MDISSRRFRAEFLQEWQGSADAPYFDPSTPRNITGLVGHPVRLLCRVKNLKNRTVSHLHIMHRNISAKGHPLQDIGLPQCLPDWSFAICIHRVPALLCRSSLYLVGDIQTLRLRGRYSKTFWPRRPSILRGMSPSTTTSVWQFFELSFE